MKKLISLLSCGMLFTSAFSQMPNTDIYLVDIQLKDGVYKFSKPYNFTYRAGYDNQPSFTPDGNHILYTSKRDTSQTDIYKFTLKDSTITQVTNTSESEYSPVMMEDEKSMSVVRVDASGAQKLIMVDLGEAAQDYELAPHEDSVAYYGWIDKKNAGITMLNGKQTQLYIYDISSYQYIILQQNTGRCMTNIPGTDEFSFTQKTTDSTFTIWRYNTKTGDRMPLCDLPVHTEDYVFTPEGKLFAGSKGKLLIYDSSTEKGEWKEIADFSETVGSFQRMAINQKGNKIALVSTGPLKPIEKDKKK